MNRLIALMALAISAFAQTAQYPGGIASDTNLKVAANGVQTALRGAISSSDTVITVADATGIVANTLLTIDREIVNVTAVSGNNLTIARGFDGTTAASHANNRTVSASVDAWHHNALAAEIKAIEAALGANLGNISGDGSGSSNASSFVWSQSPGGSLTGSIINSVILTPCPLGINGTNPAHLLYISGGTGTAETALIQGGTCTSGATTGTILFTPANSHSGAWTIGSASGGLAEATCALPAAGGSVSVTQSIILLANVGRCGKTILTLDKQPGVAITGAFTVYGEEPTDYGTHPVGLGHRYYLMEVSDTQGPGAIGIEPRMTDTLSSLGSGLGIVQADPTKLSTDQFFHGITVSLHNNVPGPTSQVGGVVGFVYSYMGADPFGGDFHAIVPDTATTMPPNVVGVQATIKVDKAGTPIGFTTPLLVAQEGNHDLGTGILFKGITNGFNQLIGTATGAMTAEGIILQPANDLNATYRAFGLVNAAGDENRWTVRKNGSTFSTGRSDIIPFDSATTAGFNIYRTEDTATNTEGMRIGAETVSVNTFGVDVFASGTGTLRPFVIAVNGTEKVRYDTDAGFLVGQACRIRTGSGSPEGAVTGSVCDLFLRQNGGASSTLYIKESGSGNTGWVAK